MGIGRKIMAGIALIVAAMVVKIYEKEGGRGEEKLTDRHELMISYQITAIGRKLYQALLAMMMTTTVVEGTMMEMMMEMMTKVAKEMTVKLDLDHVLISREIRMIVVMDG